MKKVALFAGQGSQFVGMGKDLYDNYQIAKDLFNKADEVLGYSISKLCFEGPEEDLKKTENTQPAILIVSYICYKLLEEQGYTPDAYAGFSLGEYSALTAAGYISFEDAILLVRERGLLMDKAVQGLDGGMAAILGLEDEVVEEICETVDGVLVPANYNCPGQLVISGEKKAVEEACKLAEEKDAMRTVILNVSGPFHSPLLEKGSVELKNVLDNVKFIPSASSIVYSNVTAEKHNSNSIKEMLVKQMFSPVKWRKTIENMIGEGVEAFTEFGPGKTLTGFMRKIDRKKKAFNVADDITLKKAIELMNE